MLLLQKIESGQSYMDHLNIVTIGRASCETRLNGDGIFFFFFFLRVCITFNSKQIRLT